MSREVNFQASGSDGSVSQPNCAAAPHVPTVLDQPEQQEVQKTPPDVAPPAGSAAMGPPDGPLQAQEPSRGPALAPKSPSGSSAVWKKGENPAPP